MSLSAYEAEILAIRREFEDAGYFQPGEIEQMEDAADARIHRYNPQEEPRSRKWLVAAFCIGAAVWIGIGAIVWLVL